MTAEELKALDQKRREREEELLLLLLLLLGWAVGQELAQGDTGTQPVSRTGTASPTTTPGTTNRPATGTLARLRRILTTQGAAEIAGTMADAHLDGVEAFAASVGQSVTAPDRDTLVRQYATVARDMTDAMIESIRTHLITAEGDLAQALVLAGYSKSDSRNLEIGAERNVILASNAGVLDGAVTILGKGGVLGLQHVSVMDARTTRWCRPRNGLKLPVSDPYWQKNWPSLHAGCRSNIVPLTKTFTASTYRPTLPPDKGYGEAPATIMLILKRAQRAA